MSIAYSQTLPSMYFVVVFSLRFVFFSYRFCRPIFYFIYYCTEYAFFFPQSMRYGEEGKKHSHAETEPKIVQIG